MDEKKDFEYEQYEVKTNEITSFEKKYFKFQLKLKLQLLFSIIFIALYICVGALINNYKTPTTAILLGIPLSYFSISVIFNKEKLFNLLYVVVIIIYFLIAILTKKWNYSALVLLLIPIIIAFKSVLLECKRYKNLGGKHEKY